MGSLGSQALLPAAKLFVAHLITAAANEGKGASSAFTVSLPATREFSRCWVQGLIVGTEVDRASNEPVKFVLDDGTGVVLVDARAYVQIVKKKRQVADFRLP